MSSLSVVLIVKNEAESIEKCLAEVKEIADEIIVLDSGSDDNTVELCKQMGAKIYINTDWQGFGKQRQIAQKHATKDWVFMLDADEFFTQPLRDEVKQVVADNDTSCAWKVPRLDWVFGKFIWHSGSYPGFTARLYPREKAFYNDALVHEKLLIPKGLSAKKLKNHLIHYTFKDLNHYLVKSTSYAKVWADQRVIQGKKSSILNAISHSVFRFLKMYIFRAGFLDGKHGFVLALLSAQMTFVKYLDLWVRANQPK